MISVAILEAMWVWNDYLLPTLVLDIKNTAPSPCSSSTSAAATAAWRWAP